MELLDSNEKLIRTITKDEDNANYVDEDNTAQRYQVSFPEGFTCQDCTVREFFMQGKKMHDTKANLKEFLRKT